MATKEDLRTTLRGASNGLTLAQILEIHPELARRSASRWLAELVASAEVRRSGPPRGRGGIYEWIGLPGEARALSQSASAYVIGAIPLSEGGKRVADYVSQSLTRRDPVGYRREFLDEYEPNASSYLSETLRRDLHKLGRTDDIPQPAGTYGRSIVDRLLIDLSWASSHLEGNTYSLLDTRALIENGLAASGHDLVETQMILNHKAAIEFLLENIEEVEFDAYTVKSLHGILADGLMQSREDEGRLRRHPVGIGGSVYSPLSTPQQIEDCFAVFLDKASKIVDPFEQSFFAMVHLPYLQPFADINKRTSRMLANVPLLKANLVPMTFLDVPTDTYNQSILGVYELLDLQMLVDLYMWAYPRSARRYMNIQREVTQPDPVRIKYRDAIKTSVARVVREAGSDSSSQLLGLVEELVPSQDVVAVVAIVNEELRNLHEGSIARYGLRPSEYAKWRDQQRTVD